MSESIAAERPPRPDLATITDEELAAYRDAENRFRASVELRVVTGHPDEGATIDWQEVELSDRAVPVRVYRPSCAVEGAALPLVLHVHGGGFVGTATQCDWINAHLAARLPAVVVSVEHRLLDARTPLAAAVDDDWDVLRYAIGHAERWGVDRDRIAVFGESCGALVSALVTLRAGRAGPRLRAQVLVNPCLDVSETMFDHPSFTEFAETPALDRPVLDLFHRFAVPAGTDPVPLSPLRADDLGGLPPMLVVVPTDDPLADHGRAYAERLKAAGTPTRLTEHPGAQHAFLSTPGIAPQAETAKTEITDFLRETLAATA
ncbi:alpha/beta hydrolase [Phytomonospora sp. NPDC050363]|uniref:alpha/beta hydrolase n=1 Tax=Phytomonospora sp. NPDC050363 TaxID=3155642 RepID=UPI0033D2817A